MKQTHNWISSEKKAPLMIQNTTVALCYVWLNTVMACPRAETWNLFILDMWFLVLFYKLNMFQLPPCPLPILDQLFGSQC